MTRYPWVILHHDGIHQFARVPSDNGAEYMDIVCAALKVEDVGDDVVFKSRDHEFICLRDNVQTQLTIKAM